MRISIVSVGQKEPDWVEAAVDDYRKRFPPEFLVQLVRLPLIKRGKNPDMKRIVRDEGRNIIESIPQGARVIALDVQGRGLATERIAKNIEDWMSEGRDVVIIIGGPDGLSEEVLSSVDERWSLSNMTFPHTLAKVIIMEQLYRAWSILRNHPYHRA